MPNQFRITEICKERGITQTELAEKIGISRVGLSKAVNGNTTIATLNKIAAALGVSVSDLFTPPEEKPVACPWCGKPVKISLGKGGTMPDASENEAEITQGNPR